MQISHVRYFLALCRDKNFTLAAKRCGISQPSLTNAIKRFERELGGPLFHRSLTGTTLSELGQAVRPHLERLIQCADDARRAATTYQIATARLDHHNEWRSRCTSSCILPPA